MLTKKQYQLMSYLYKATEPMTADDLARRLGFSSRTVMRYIKEINCSYRQDNLKITSISGNGYTLQDEDNIFPLLIEQDQVIWEIRFSKPVIMLMHVACQGPITLDKISERIFLSLSSTEKLVIEAKRILDKFNLSLTGKPYYGIELSGGEQSIRNLLADVGFSTKHSVLESTVIPNIKSNEMLFIRDFVYETLRNKRIIEDDISVTNLIIRIIVAISRIRSKKSYFTNMSREDIPGLGVEVIKEIMDAVGQRCGVKIHQNEVFYVALFSGFMLNSKGLAVIVDEEDVYQITQAVVREMLYFMGIEYKENSALFRPLNSHIKIMVNRLQNGCISSNHILEDIKRNYIVEMSYAVRIAKEIERKYKIEVPEGEIGYLAIHLGTYRNIVCYNRRTIVLCSFGVGTSQIISQKIREHFPNIDVIATYPVYYWEMVVQQDVDFVITTVPIPEYSSPKPLIVAQNILMSDSMQELKKQINSIAESKTSLDKYFDPSCFFRCSVQGREEVLKLLTDKLAEKFGADNTVIHSILDREQMSSTDIGNMVAIPHAICKGEFESVISVAILDQPIKWNQERVQLVFMACFNQKDSKDVSVFRSLYKIIKTNSNVVKLIHSKQYEDFMQNLIELGV